MVHEKHFEELDGKRGGIVARANAAIMAAAQAGGGGGGVLSQVCRLIGEPKRADLATFHSKFFGESPDGKLEDALLDDHLWQLRPRMNTVTIKTAYMALPKEQRVTKRA